MRFLPIFLTAALAFAAGALVMRHGAPNFIAGARELLSHRLKFWRCRGGAGVGRETAAATTSNHAFEGYRAATLKRLESEARDFRVFLDGLRRSSDAADFQAFLQARRDTRALR